MELLSPMHLLIIFAVALLIFGPKKLPELGKGIGEGFRALKDGMKDKPAEHASTAAPAATPTSTPPISNNPASNNPASTNPEVKS